MKRFRQIIIWIFVAAAMISATIYLYYRYRYPYGFNHVCDGALSKCLFMYAKDHGGNYPTGGPTPEASLSMIYSNYLETPATIAGKGADVERASKILKAGGLLSPSECNWHYVEGLTENDDSRLAILWDKLPGLGHNCERLKDGRRCVVYLDGSCDYITKSKWQEFLAEQERLMSNRIKKPTID